MIVTQRLTSVGDVVEGPLEFPGELRPLQDDGVRRHAGGRRAGAAAGSKTSNIELL